MNEFELIIDFEVDSPRPSRVFRSMAGMIDAYDYWDKDVLSSLDLKASSSLLLHDIEKGSLRSILRRILQIPDEEALREGNWNMLLGRLLDNTRKILVEKLTEEPEVTSVRQFEEIRDHVHQASNFDSARLIPVHMEIPLPRILQTIRIIEASTKILLPRDSVRYHSEAYDLAVPCDVRVDPELEEALLEKEELSHQTKVILPVKRPVYIGDSQWEFYMGGSFIRAKIMDVDWLQDFHSRSVELKPGDGLEADIEITMLKSASGEVAGYRYLITRVHKVVSMPRGAQLDFFDPPE